MKHQPDSNTYDTMKKLMTREGFLGLSVAAFGAVASLAVGIPIIGYVLGPAIEQPKNKWRDVRMTAPDGTVGDLVRTETIPLGRTLEVAYPNADPLPWAGATAMNGSWLRRTGPEEFVAFSMNCTHLDCPVHYLSGARIFLCPCHGSVFNDDGTVAGGPAARPLPRYPVRVKRGRVQIHTEPLPLRF